MLRNASSGVVTAANPDDTIWVLVPPSISATTFSRPMGGRAHNAIDQRLLQPLEPAARRSAMVGARRLNHDVRRIDKAVHVRARPPGMRQARKDVVVLVVDHFSLAPLACRCGRPTPSTTRHRRRLEGGRRWSWRRQMQAVTPLPQVVTTGRLPSMPAAARHCVTLRAATMSDPGPAIR